MYSELFYIGIEAGLQGDMTKEAILGRIRQSLAGLGERASDVTAQAAANIYNKPMGQKATHLGIDFIQEATRRATANPALEGALMSNAGTLGSNAVQAADFALSQAHRLPGASAKGLNAAMRGVDQSLGQGARLVRQNPAIVRSGADFTTRRAQRLRELGLAAR